MPRRHAVHFPPHSLSDLILHYHDVDFHVHKLVLHQQSAYFRACLLSLQPAAASGAAAGRNAAQEPSSSASASSSSLSLSAIDSGPSHRPAKRGRSSALVSPQPAVSAPPPVEAECCHSPAVACLQLPDQLGVHPADTDVLQLFLEHLYFPSAHPFPPFWPRVRVDLSVAEDDSVPPLFPTLDSAAISQYCKHSVQGSVVMSPGLLSLIHYFDAKRLWQQVIAVIQVRGASPRLAWYWLSRDLTRFGLKAEEDWLIQQVAKDTAVVDSDKYRQYLSSLSPSVTARLIQAIHQNWEGRRAAAAYSSGSDDSE